MENLSDIKFADACLRVLVVPKDTPSRIMASKDFNTLLANIDLDSLVDFSKKSLLISLASIAFNPTAWNIVAQNGMPTCHVLR